MVKATKIKEKREKKIRKRMVKARRKEKGEERG
jgi:hypothetical protein